MKTLRRGVNIHAHEGCDEIEYNKHTHTQTQN